VPLLNVYKHLKGMFGDGKLNDPFMIKLFANAEKENSHGTPSSFEVVPCSKNFFHLRLLVKILTISLDMKHCYKKI
jgi:hypothetical protein